MIWQLNKTLTIPFLVTDTYGVPITSGVTPVCVIRKSDGQYWNSSTSAWQVSEYANPMTHSFKGVWVFNFTPTIEDQFIVRTSESVNKVEGGLGFSTSTNLNNSDVKTSTRSTVTEISIWNHSGRSLTSFGSLVNDIAVAVWGYSSRILTGFSTLVSDIWSNTSRTLTPSNVQGVGAVSLSITLANDISVIVYNSLKQALYQGVSESGNITFNLNSGEYYIYYSKDGFYSKQEKLIIPNVASYLHSVELSPIVGDTDLNIKVRELPSKSTVYKDEVLKIGIELFAEKDFSIMSATASSGTVEVVGKKVFSTVTFSTLGNMVIEFDVQVGNQTITHRVSKKVV